MPRAPRWLPRLGLDDIAEPQVPVGGPGITLSRVPGPQPVTEEVPVDVGHLCPMLGSDSMQRHIQLSQNVDDLRPRRQPHPRGIAGAVTGVIDGAHDHRITALPHSAAHPHQGLPDASAHHRDHLSGAPGVAVRPEQIVAADGETIVGRESGSFKPQKLCI
jgi:hypothetical protein